jgi:nucleotide-binding universal stress UspA family protein
MYQRILVPVDGSPTSKLGLDEAIKLAGLTGARLRLINVDIMEAASKRVQQHEIGVGTALFECFDRRVSDLVGANDSGQPEA